MDKFKKKYIKVKLTGKMKPAKTKGRYLAILKQNSSSDKKQKETD